MADKVLTVLGVHGLGDHRDSDWQVKWPDAIKAAFPAVEGLSLEFRFVTYDDIFEETDISFADTAAALWKLTKSGVSAIGRRERGVISDISDKIRWTAGYVVAWVEDELQAPEPQARARRRARARARRHSRPQPRLARHLQRLFAFGR